MKFERMPAAMPRSGDSPAMLKAIKQLRAAGHDVRRPANSSHQLKVRSDLSYYPGTGTIFRDGDPAPAAERGMRVLLSTLAQEFKLELDI